MFLRWRGKLKKKTIKISITTIFFFISDPNTKENAKWLAYKYPEAV